MDAEETNLRYIGADTDVLNDLLNLFFSGRLEKNQRSRNTGLTPPGQPSPAQGGAGSRAPAQRNIFCQGLSLCSLPHSTAPLHCFRAVQGALRASVSEAVHRHLVFPFHVTAYLAE